jgi:hypothetical protein
MTVQYKMMICTCLESVSISQVSSLLDKKFPSPHRLPVSHLYNHEHPWPHMTQSNPCLTKRKKCYPTHTYIDRNPYGTSRNGINVPRHPLHYASSSIPLTLLPLPIRIFSLWIGVNLPFSKRKRESLTSID